MNPLSPDFDSRRKFVIAHGRFAVYHDPLAHLPYGLYRIYAGDKYVGAQLSYPSKSDCEWLQLQRKGTVYAMPSKDPVDATHYLRGASYQQWLAKRTAA